MDTKKYHTHYDEIGVCAKNVSAILCVIVNIRIGRSYVITERVREFYLDLV